MGELDSKSLCYSNTGGRRTIEKTFEALMKLVKELGDEEVRAAGEGLNEETLAVFDLLLKRSLSGPEINRIKKVAVELLERLKARIGEIDHWRERESTRDALRGTIRDFLWDDRTGLPVDSFAEVEVEAKTEDIFRHIYRVYPTVPSPYYSYAT